MATVTRIIPNGSTVDRIFPPVPDSGTTPAPPTPPSVTLANDDTLITNLAVTDAQEVDEHILAPGWSY